MPAIVLCASAAPFIAIVVRLVAAGYRRPGAKRDDARAGALEVLRRGARREKDPPAGSLLRRALGVVHAAGSLSTLPRAVAGWAEDGVLGLRWEGVPGCTGCTARFHDDSVELVATGEDGAVVRTTMVGDEARVGAWLAGALRRGLRPL